MPTNYTDDMLNPEIASVNTTGLDPGTIAAFSGQAQAGQARRSQMLKALLARKDRPAPAEMVTMNIGGKTYAVPPQHVAGIMQAQQQRIAYKGGEAMRTADLAKATGAESRAVAEEGREVAEAKRVTEGLIDGRTPKEHYDVAASKKLSQPKGVDGITPATTLAREKFDYAKTQDVQARQEKQLHYHGMIISGKGKKDKNGKASEINMDMRTQMAEDINADPVGNKFYFQQPGRFKYSDPVFKALPIPGGKYWGGHEVSKGLILDQWQRYNKHPSNEPLELLDFIKKIVNPNIR